MPFWIFSGVCFVAVMLFFTAAWLVSLYRGKVCVVDSFWGLGFVLTAWLGVALGSGERQPLSRISGTSDQPRVGPYFFSNDGLELGQRALSAEETAISDLVVVDEVGPWELRDQGWAGCLYRLTTETRHPMIWVVRESIIDQVIDHWGLEDPLVIPVSETDPVSVCRLIRKTLCLAPLQLRQN